MRTEDYPRELVEQLIPTIFDRTYAWGMKDEAAPDPQMPRGSAMKNRRNTLWAHLADIRRAYDLADLLWRERVALTLCGGLGLSHQDAGRYAGIKRTAMREAYDAAVSKLYVFLNGEPEWEELPAAAA